MGAAGRMNSCVNGDSVYPGLLEHQCNADFVIEIRARAGRQARGSASRLRHHHRQIEHLFLFKQTAILQPRNENPASFNPCYPSFLSESLKQFENFNRLFRH
jgi:hypothetical protein